MLLAAGFARGEWDGLAFSGRSVGALTYLIVFGAVAGFGAYTYALKHLPIAVVSLYAYINPVIAVVLGTLILSEPFGPRMFASAAVVLCGVWMVSAQNQIGRRASDLGSAAAPSDDASSADQTDQEQHDRDDQQHVNEVAQRVAAHHSEQP
jgi:multidrug transporter EmrE-like cation transporter